MPRQLAELKQFGSGIKSSPSDTDIHPESAIYSKNIDPISEAGKLKGIKEHLKVLPNDGSLNFIIIPPWDNTARDGVGNGHPNGATDEEEEIVVSINDVTVTEKALFVTNVRTTNDNFWTSLETKLEAAFSDLEGATLGRGDHGQGIASDLDTFTTSVAFTNGPTIAVIISGGSGTGLEGTCIAAGGNITDFNLTAGGLGYIDDEVVTITEVAGTPGVATARINGIAAYTTVDHYDSDGNAWDGDDEATDEIITGTDLQPYRQVGLEFKSSVATIDMYVTWNKYDANGIKTTKTYYVSDSYVSPTEFINASKTWDVIKDDTSYLEMNATEMESFNDEAKNHIAFYSITTNDSTSSTGSATTYRMKVFNDVYGVKTIEDKYVGDDETTDVYYDVPGTPADVTLEKNNAQIFIGTGNTLASKSKWFGKIKHKQFGNSIEGYRLTDSETLPIDKGQSVFNLDHIDYGYNGAYAMAPTSKYEWNWDTTIAYGISPGMMKLVAFRSSGTVDSSGAAPKLGVQIPGANTLIFSPTMIYGSRWLWEELSPFTGGSAGDPWTPTGQSNQALSAWTHEGAGHTYFWATDKNSNKLHIISSDASDFSNSNYDHSVPISLTVDFANGSQSAVEGSIATDIMETTGDQATAGNTIVYVLFTQKSDTAYTWDEEFLYYFNPESDITWNALTVTLHECTPPTPKLKFYGSWRQGNGIYATDHVYPNFHKRTHDYWAGTWNVKSNYMYWRFSDVLGKKASGAPTEPDNGPSNSDELNGVKGNEFYHSRMSSGANSWRLGTNVGWADDEEYLITPKRRGLIDLADTHNSVGLVAHVKGKFVTDAGRLQVATFSNWTPRYRYIYGYNSKTSGYDEVCMFNINPNHKGVRHRQIAEEYHFASFVSDDPTDDSAINQADDQGGAHGDSYNAACDRGIWMSGFGYFNGYSEYDHYIIKFEGADASTGFTGSNEINQISNEVAGIASMSRRILDFTNSGTATSAGAHRFFALLQGEDGSEAVLGSWHMVFPDGASLAASTPTGKWLPTSDSWVPMIFKESGTPSMAIGVPRADEDFKQANLPAVGSNTPANANIDNIDYSIQLSATQGEFFIGRATMKFNGSYTAYSNFVPPSIPDTESLTPYMSYYSPSQLEYGLAFTSGDIVDVEEDSANFENGTVYYYKMTLIYDGFQESPLNTFYFKYAPPARYDTVVIKIRLNKPPERCSALVIYRKNNVEEFYRMVEEKEFKGGFGKTGDEYFSVIVDDGNLGATYEAITGMPESLRDTSINYKLSTSAGGYLVVANCYHKDIVNGQNFIFRSMPGNFSIFNWSKDFCILPNEPTALAYWAGRIYAFDKSNMYKIDLNSLAIEDIHEGVGCFGEQSFIITDYGMFFCDANNLYQHNGTNIIPIGNDILKNSKFDDLGIDTKAWHNIDHAYSPYVQYDAFNQNVMFQFEDTDGEYGSWNYNIPRKRWDLIDIPKPRASVQGNLGELWLSDSDFIYKLGEGSGRKKFDHYTPSMDFNYATVDKRLKRMKIVFNSAADIVKATYNLKMLADEAVVDLTKATVKDEENVRTYRLKGPEVRRAKKVRLEITNSNVEIDSIGISYNIRTIK